LFGPFPVDAARLCVVYDPKFIGVCHATTPFLSVDRPAAVEGVANHGEPAGHARVIIPRDSDD
jgi:hypothetical protein